MVVDHPQSPLDGQIIVAENVRPLQAEQQDHLCRPDADALQAAQFPDGLLIAHVRHGIQIKGTCVNFFGKVRDVLRLAERHAQSLQLRDSRRQNGFGIDLAQRILHPLPDGGLRPGGDLLSDDVVDDSGKQIRVHRPVDMPDAVDHLTEPLVLFAQIGKRLFSVCEIHPVTSLRFAILLYNSEVCNAIRKYGEAAFDARKKLVCIFCLFLLCFMYCAVYAVFFT